MFSLWTVISFSFSSSLMIFSLCIMGLETCICGFIFLSCVVYPSFFVWWCCCWCCSWCVPSRVFLPLISRPFFLHTSSHTPLLCLSVRFCDVPPSPLTPLTEDTDSPSRTNSGLSFLLLCFSRLPPRRVPAPLCLSHSRSGTIHPKLKIDLSSRESWT